MLFYLVELLSLFHIDVMESTPRSAVDVYNIMFTISGACRSQMVHMMRTAAQASQPRIPHNLLDERLPFSADKRDLIELIIWFDAFVYIVSGTI